MFGEKRGAECHKKNSSLTARHGGGVIMLWACVAPKRWSDHASGLCCTQEVDQLCFGPVLQPVARGNISLVEGRTDSIKCQQILEGNIKLSVKKLKRRGWLPEQYNDPKHI